MGQSYRRPEHERFRSSRKREVRKCTLSFRRAAEARVAMGLLGLDGTEKREPRHLPLLRGDCPEPGSPCPYVTCRYHLFLDVNSAKESVTLNFPDLQLEQLQHSCCLDVADQGGATLEQVGEIMNMTRERIRQIEEIALKKLRAARRALR